MTVYVDDVRHRYGRMVMCHCWADSREELFAMMQTIGMNLKWFQCPPKASWEHFDISLGMKAKAIAAGAILTDRYGPSEHTAKLKLASLRARPLTPEIGNLIEYNERCLRRIEECRARAAAISQDPKPLQYSA